MNSHIARLALAASLLSSLTASASNLPEAIGFDASMEAVGQVLSSPALPSLDNDGFSITPLYGIVKMEGVDETVTSEGLGESVYENRGELKGDIAGLTFNYSGKGDLGVFLTTAWSRVDGDMQTSAFGNTSDVRDISAQSFVGALGLTYRAVGTDKSTFALGLFGGPAYISSTTSAKFFHEDGTVTKVTLNPKMNAIYFGLQLMFRFGEFRLNPFLNLLGNPSVGCEKPTYEGDPYPIAQYNRCMNGDPGISTIAAIGGSGINIGYGRFQLSLIQIGGSGSQSLKSTPLMISYRIGL